MSWIHVSCAVCGTTEADPIFSLAEAAAPGGEAMIVRCRLCGLRRLDPRPDTDDLAACYGDDYYTLQGRSRGALKQAVWDRLRDVSGVEIDRGPAGQLVAAAAAAIARRTFDINVPIGARPPRVLDVGCGFGDLLVYLKQRGCDVLGVDFDPQAAEVGQRYGAPILVGDIRRLNLEPESFDVAVMSHSLEHLEDPLGTLCRLGELLRPEGSLQVAVPNGAAPGLEIQRQEWGALCYPVHLWYFDPITLSSLLARAGFVVAWSNSADIVSHHVAFWRRRLAADPMPAGRELVTALSRRVRTPLSGDVLRVVAVRPAVPFPSAMAVP